MASMSEELTKKEELDAEEQIESIDEEFSAEDIAEDVIVEEDVQKEPEILVKAVKGQPVVQKEAKPEAKKPLTQEKQPASRIQTKKLPSVQETNSSFSFKAFYEQKYKLLLMITFIILLLAIAQIALQYRQTGDFMYKDVSLRGGISITVAISEDVNVQEVKDDLLRQMPGADISVRKLLRAGSPFALTISASGVDTDALQREVEQLFHVKEGDYSVEVVGSAIGQSFFQQTFKAIIIAFLLMGLVVFLYFCEVTKPKVIAAILTFIIIGLSGNTGSKISLVLSLALFLYLLYIYITVSMPSFAVILCAFSDIIVTLAIINLLGVRLSTAGIAGFLMLIGYSVDTDILLSTRVLKNKEGKVLDRVYGAMTTGMTMTLTTLAAVSVTYFIVQSDVLRQIMFILIIGLFVDILYTWIQNAGIIRWFMEKRS